MNREWLGPAVLIAACLLVQLAGGLATEPAISSGWYRGLLKPSWTPPDSIFGPVWTALYLMMATAACLVWNERRHKPVGVALGVFSWQLLLNLAWSLLFFGSRLPLAGLANILLLLAAIGVTTVLFFRVRFVAGLLMVPYFLWTAYAAALNWAIVGLNPQPVT